MKEVCEKLQASGITPFAATYKDAWTLNHLFSCLQGAAVGDYESWVADMNAGKGSFRNDNSSLEFDDERKFRWKLYGCRFHIRL